MKKNTQKKILFYNTSIAILNQIVVLICGFILPRQIITTYGSETNGLILSITQFLGFVVLMDMGIGAVVRTSLYKPLVDENNNEISKIIKSAKKFYNKIGLIFLFYIIVLCIIYPSINNTGLSHSFIVPLIVSISISNIAQYFFGIVYQLLLDADQKAYIQLIFNASAIILNTIISVILMKCNYSIQFVKFATSIILLIKPLGIFLYVKNHYVIDKKIIVDKEPIKQKWNGLAQHISAYILSNTDVVVLTFFSSMKNVSVYNVYYLVVAGVRQCITTVTTGVDAMFGKMYAQGSSKLNKYFGIYEWFLHTLSSFLFAVTAVLICSFVSVYTKGVNDINYIYPLFAILITAAFGFYSIRLPYNTMVLVAGHYKETQSSAIVEALINIIVSVICVKKFGIYGVALGTLIAMIYRTIYLAYYLSKAILYRKIQYFINHIVVDLVMVCIIFFSTYWLVTPISSYFEFICLGVKVSFLALVEIIFINLVFYKKEMSYGINFIKEKFLKKKTK